MQQRQKCQCGMRGRTDGNRMTGGTGAGADGVAVSKGLAHGGQDASPIAPKMGGRGEGCVASDGALIVHTKDLFWCHSNIFSAMAVG